VELVAELDGDCPWVLADPLHIEQVLMNLCINARDAMGGKGRLLVRLGTAKGADGVCASCHQPIRGDFAELAVCDQGPGIAPQVLERIFEPFYSTKEVGKGSGMGLAMVHGIVHEYGGHIRVDTAPGGGTAMRILLPAWAQPEPGPGGERARLAGEPAASGAPGCLRGRVLVAEDEPAVRELMEDLLSGWGLAVELAENGVDACERFAADPDGFDLAILDQTMPRMSGLEAAVELLKLRPGLPVCLYTGHSERLPEGRVAAAGIRAQARKPLDIPAFRVLIEGLLSERR
jgi:CheY-like chemotaxis protein